MTLEQKLRRIAKTYMAITTAINAANNSHNTHLNQFDFIFIISLFFMLSKNNSSDYINEILYALVS